MKVSELIEELKNLPQDSWVCVMEEGNTATVEMLEESSMRGDWISPQLSSEKVNIVYLMA